MILSPNGLKFIEGFESLSLTAYPDAKGYSIGYGHYGATKGQVIDLQQAQLYLMQDTLIAANAVNNSMKAAIPLNQNQFDALTSLVYNIGIGDYKKSSIRLAINLGKYTLAGNDFTLYCDEEGVFNEELYKRRVAEQKLFNTGV